MTPALTQRKCSRTVLSCPILCLCVIGAIVGVIPARSQNSATTGRSSRAALSDILKIPTAIPGTSEYHMQQQAAELEEVLGEFDAVVSARVILRPASDEAQGPAAMVQLQLAGDEAWSGELCHTIVALIRQLQPELTAEAILIADRQGRVLFENARMAIAAAEPEPTSQPELGASAPSRPAIIGAGIALGLVVVVVWWLLASRSVSGVRTQAPAADNQWAFLATADRSKLKRVLAAQRPELVGAIVAQLDERTARRLRPVLRAIDSGVMAPPDRQMHPDIADAVAGKIRHMLAEEEQ